ncbi:MAG: molecular chaperone HtpG [Gammaproteobacteria bacterium]
MSENMMKETRGFEAEVKQLLHLMVHSLYSNKEIFLRELISNAQDATDKLRFEGLSNSALFEENDELRIRIDYDKDKATVTIWDNGIGMSKEEVIKNLGTIARSGTQEFIKALTPEQVKDRNLIGQFGVGFYSSFIIADKVTVRTRRAGLASSEGVEWESEGKGEYTIQSIEKQSKGTEVILHLKPEEKEFLNGHRLRHIVKKYSDHIPLPIYMKVEDAHMEDKDNEKEAETKEEIVNRATAIWTLPKSEIKEEEYTELYKHIAHDYEGPLTWVHNKVEGKLDYTTLLYIPSHAPFDLWQADAARGLKLYVQRVFIMDDCDQFLPNYLRFMRGIVDSNDLPLNVSREILQSNRMMDSMRSSIVKKTLSMLKTLSQDEPEKYSTFWKEFGQVIKEGPAEDFANREQIAELLRFSSTKAEKEEQTVSLDDYISRMPEGQTKIYYLAADTFNAARHSPHLEAFRAKEIEVFLLYERVDEWLMSHLTEYKGKTFQSVARGSLDDLSFAKSKDNPESKEELEEKAKSFEPVVERIKNALKDKVKDVRLTERLTTSPACIVADVDQMTSQMERILKAAGKHVESKPILELNPEHMLVKRLQQEDDSERFGDLSQILLDQAILSEGGQLDDPATFVKRFNELLLDVAKV